MEIKSSIAKTNDKRLYVFFLIALCVVFHFRLIFSGSGGILFGLDYINQFYGFKELIVSEYRSWTFPLWNPYSFAGMPLLAVPWSGALYPLDAIYQFLPVFTALRISVVIHTILMAAGMFFLSLEFEATNPAALLAAAAYAFCSHFFWQVRSGHISEIIAAAWLPFILLYFLRFRKTGRNRWVVLSAAALAMALLGGNYQYVYYGMIAFGVWLLASNVMEGMDRRQWPRSLAACAAVVAAALLLTACQILPTMEFFANSSRGEASRFMVGMMSFAPRDYLGFLFPFYSHLFYENVPYFGLVPLGFVFAGLLWRDKLRKTLPLLISGLAIAVLMMGNKTPAFEALFRYFPLYKFFRIHSSAVPVLVLMVCPIAAMGFSRLFPLQQEKPPAADSGRNGNPWRVTLMVFAVMSLVVMDFWIFGWLLSFHSVGEEGFKMVLTYFPYGNNWKVVLPAALPLLAIAALLLSRSRARRAGMWLLISMAVADLFLVSLGLIGLRPMEAYQSLAGPAAETIEHDPASRHEYRVWFPVNLLNTNHNIHLRVSNVNGYCSLNVDRFRKYVFHALGIADDSLATHPFGKKMFKGRDRNFPLGLLNVKYRAAYDPDKDDFTVIREDHYVPRAFWIGKWKSVPTGEAALQAVTARDFDPTRELILEFDPDFEQSFGAETALDAPIISYRPRRIKLQVHALDQGFLVLNEMFFPGWTAYVDGKKTRIRRADYILRAVPVDKGSHEVVFVYNPRSFYLGLLISLVSLAGFIMPWKRFIRAKNPPAV